MADVCVRRAGTYSELELGLYFRSRSSVAGPVACIDGKQVVSFADFGVLGLQRSAEYRDAYRVAFEQYGASTGSARVFYEDAVVKSLEHRVADVFGAVAGTVYPSATIAHLALLPVLRAQGFRFLVSDQVHRSVRNGLKFAKVPARRMRIVPRCPKRGTIEKGIRAFRGQRIVFVCDSLYGVDGVKENLEEIAATLARWNGVLYIDDSHATGLFGPRGVGLGARVLGLCPNSIVVGTFGKAIGAYGGFAVMPRTIQDISLLKSTVALFTGPLPPPVVAQVAAGWEIILGHKGNALRAKLFTNAGIFAKACGRTWHGSHLFFFQTSRPMDVAGALFDAGYLVNPIRYPAVPRDQEGIRVVVSSAHDDEQLQDLAAAIRRVTGLSTGPRA